MKFRVKTNDSGCIQYFNKVIMTIAKLSKTSIIRITKDKIFFILHERAVTGGVCIWCELKQEIFFHEHAMEGLSCTDDEILMEIVLEQLVRCLRSCSSARSLKLKLTKKFAPCLTIEIEQPASSFQSRLVLHDVPVRIVPRRLWDDFMQPPDPAFDVSIYFPSLKAVRPVVEKMKNLSPYLTIAANCAGELRLTVRSDLVVATTFFSGLEQPTWRAESEEGASEAVVSQRQPREFVEATVDIKRLNQLLSGQQMTPNRIVCSA